MDEVAFGQVRKSTDAIQHYFDACKARRIGLLNKMRGGEAFLIYDLMQIGASITARKFQFHAYYYYYY